jgi:hypothetical protein
MKPSRVCKSLSPEYIEERCGCCGSIPDECNCDPEEVIAFEKKRLEALFDCDVTINLYKEGALMASTEED